MSSRREFLKKFTGLPVAAATLAGIGVDAIDADDVAWGGETLTPRAIVGLPDLVVRLVPIADGRHVSWRAEVDLPKSEEMGVS